MLLAIIECCELLIPTAPVNTAKLIFEKAKGTALNEVFPYNIKANPHIFVIKIPGTPSQIPNAPSHATNTPSPSSAKDIKYANTIKKYANQNTKYTIPMKKATKTPITPILIFAVLSRDNF